MHGVGHHDVVPDRLPMLTELDRLRAIVAAARSIQQGLLVVVPTDTVYGLVCDARSTEAVERLLWAKGRWKDLPLTIAVEGTSAATRLVGEISPDARTLMESFWPGPLTLMVRRAPGITLGIGEEAGVLSLRAPSQPALLELLAITGPLVMTTASRSGVEAARTVDAAEEQLGGRVAVYLDGGPSPATTTSSIVDLTAPVPRLVRTGQLSLDELRAACPAIAGPEGPT
jgi:tRNA threonylcarbamoyl adenosine modification protein (Sua5/YciO/YrdC/YwlC family)